MGLILFPEESWRALTPTWIVRKEIYDAIDNSCGQFQPVQFLYEYSITHKHFFEIKENSSNCSTVCHQFPWTSCGACVSEPGWLTSWEQLHIDLGLVHPEPQALFNQVPYTPLQLSRDMESGR